MTTDSIDDIEFKTVANDNTKESLITLTNFKNLIAKQLRKMDLEYIVRLVFDFKHESLVISKGKKIIGGACYRLNTNQLFIELVFLVISETEQIKGYGTKLMNRLKDNLREKGISYILTFADNSAINYFKKQGFSTEIKCPYDIWKGLIKEYDKATLMEATINQNISYMDFKHTLNMQKDYLISLCKGYLNVRKENSITELERVIKLNNSEVSSSINSIIISEKLFNLIPGVKDSQWSYNEYVEIKKTKNSFKSKCFNILAKLKEEKTATPFLLPVDPNFVPDYYNIIKEPMGKLLNLI
jgi:histone acetyltransferase